MTIDCFPLTPFLTNCFVLKDAGEAMVIDPGEAAPELIESLADHKVVMIVNTHCHIDHCAGNAGMVKATRAPLACHRDDLPLLHGIQQQGRFFGVHCEPSPDPDRFLEAGDRLQVGKVSLEVRFAPGHAPGHVVLVGDGFVFGGDVLFQGSIGRTDLPGGSYPQLMESIRTQLLTLPDHYVVYNGHTPPTTIGEERRTNPFLVGL